MKKQVILLTEKLLKRETTLDERLKTKRKILERKPSIYSIQEYQHTLRDAEDYRKQVQLPGFDHFENSEEEETGREASGGRIDVRKLNQEIDTKFDT